MPFIDPLPRTELEAFEPFFASVEASMGFVPNSLPTMAHRPDILSAFAGLAGAVLAAGTVDAGLKQLVALVASTSSGCRYCQAHTASTATHRGVSLDKLDAVYEFETSTLFSAAERAALRLARDAAILPNCVTGKHFAELRDHFDVGEVVELMSVVSLFGWLNRWNDSMATQLEEEPLEFASAVLASHGWVAGKHRPDPAN